MGTDRKTAILEAATQLFAQKGFSETSTAEIAENARVAQGTLFYHFTNKQGIIREIFSRAGSVYLAELNKALARQDTGMEKIKTAIRFNRQYSEHHSREILIFLRIFPDLKDTQSPERDLIELIRTRVTEMIRQCLASGIKDGTIECRNVDETAWIINSLIFGINHMNFMVAAGMPDLTANAVNFCSRALEPSTTGRQNNANQQGV
ncbi:MAG: TetR/AcrR family transcriptional regulator [Desulfobacterales bacterium]